VTELEVLTARRARRLGALVERERATPTPWSAVSPSWAPVMVDNGEVGTADLREEEIESRFEATLAVGLVRPWTAWKEPAVLT